MGCQEEARSKKGRGASKGRRRGEGSKPYLHFAPSISSPDSSGSGGVDCNIMLGGAGSKRGRGQLGERARREGAGRDGRNSDLHLVLHLYHHRNHLPREV